MLSQNNRVKVLHLCSCFNVHNEESTFFRTNDLVCRVNVLLSCYPEPVPVLTFTLNMGIRTQGLAFSLSSVMVLENRPLQLTGIEHTLTNSANIP